MVTEKLIRKQFINQILRRDIAFIYETQANVIRHNFNNERAMQLSSFLASRPFCISGDGLAPTYSMSIYPYLRFLDIKYCRKDESSKRSMLPLYNRLIWGRLYGKTINDLRYGLTQDIRDTIISQLEKMNPDKL